MDIHRDFAEVVVLDGAELTHLGRVAMTRDHLRTFAAKLEVTDHVVLESTGNTTSVVEILSPHAARVAVANPLQVHLIAKAKTKTDKIDAGVLAKLYGAGFLPEVWTPDEATLARRRQVARRTQLVKHRVRLKAFVHSILHAHLVPRCPHADLFGGKGRAWLRAQELPEDERSAVERHLAEYDRLTVALKEIEKNIAKAALDDADVKRLMTIPGIDMIVAVGVMAAIGRIDRFASPDALVAYIGLNPSVFQSGDGPAHHGRITKRGRSHARFLLVEAAWQTVRTAGPLRAFYERVRARRGAHIAAVAVARKLAILIWHLLTKGEDYAWASPALMARKHRTMELAAGMPAERGKKGASADYNLPDRRRADRAGAELAEDAYRRMVEGWRKTQKRKSAGATTEERL
ncbi:MAG: IS110 family transposase [Alphaproteobacteria bacterium HGW-Alphaproteobacteria-5]|nr:MAG: IS110 family transposase [Alphaproteobacteria bacterium HGW-Alphaproteobacteria-5]